MTANTLVTLFTIVLAVIAGYLSSQQTVLVMQVAVAAPLLGASVAAVKHLITEKGPGSWVACFMFIWAVTWIAVHNMYV